MLSPATAREAVHVLMLQRLVGVRKGMPVILKGGVNLRLFFGSVRYSADMDLDGDSSARLAIREEIHRSFQDRTFLRRLQELGIRGLDAGEGPNKDTATTFRFKFGVLMPGDLRYATKIEVSFREKVETDSIVVDTPPVTVVSGYLANEPRLPIPHYDGRAATRQKIVALASRSQVQARDVFDIHLLLRAERSRDLSRFLASAVAGRTLGSAYERALRITYSQYEGQVLEFLDDKARERYGSAERWDELRLRTAALVEAAMSQQGET